MENYRLQTRLGSSNIIEKRITNENGVVRWIPFVAPLGLKETGDITANELLKFFNQKIYVSKLKYYDFPEK